MSHPPSATPPCVLVTGTDTGIGKTTVTCAIAAALAGRGMRVGVVKPCETGCEPAADGTLEAVDARRLQFFSGCTEPLAGICPERFREPLAPAAAARRAGRTVDLARLATAVRAIAGRHDVTFVEGAGGLTVPVAERTTFADLAREWHLPVLVVVGNRLGALNHAQLTLDYAHSHGLAVAGYVINALAPKDDLAASSNREWLETLLGAPLGALPWLGDLACDEASRQRAAAAAEAGVDLDALVGRWS